VRRFAGPEANELAILCRPEGQGGDPPAQSEAVYRALAGALAAARASFGDLTAETLFLRDIARDLPAVLEARQRVLAASDQGEVAPRPAFVGQAPLQSNAHLELAAAAVVPHDRSAWSVIDLTPAASCACPGCARSGARLVRLGGQEALQISNVYGTGADAFESARNTFLEAEKLLQRAGMDFGDVVRTWIHLRDIDRDYDALNRARRDFFRSRGLDLLPASTGVQGIPFPAVHDFSMSLCALKSPNLRDVAAVSTPSLSEAWSYGADFSRGLRVVEANKVTLYVSGTASIDERGSTVHTGDFAAQVERMLHNIGSLLAQEGVGFADLTSGIAYVKRRADAPLLRSLFREKGFDGFPCALVEAPLCRPELLCEAEAVAVLPPAGLRR